jgi:hypothetical protein
MVADKACSIIYMNKTAEQLFEDAEADIRKGVFLASRPPGSSAGV